MAKMKPMSAGQAPQPGDNIDPFDSQEITPAGDTEEFAAVTPTTEPVDAEPVRQVRPAAPRPKRDDEIELLKAMVAEQNKTIAGLTAKIATLAVGTLAEQANASEIKEQRSREYAEKCGRPLEVRVQEIVDQKYTEGKNRFKVFLDDKNGHPKLVIPAETPADALGRYEEICGIRSCDKSKYFVNDKPYFNAA